MSGRPLDVLEAAVGTRVTVQLKGGETHRGTLAGYDQHMNLVVDPIDAEDPAETGGTGDEAVEDTTIIRGDNVVSISP